MADITSATREMKELNPLCQVLLNLALAEIKRYHINPLVVETYRTQQRQYYLYCKGRTVSECVAKGIKKSFAQKYCSLSVKKVTWTLNSFHTQRNAVDIIPLRRGKAIWNYKDKETKMIIKIMEKYGFEAGANWTSSPDSAHYQIRGVTANGITYSRRNTNPYITMMIQKALNKKLEVNLVVDGIWGKKTNAAVNEFRITQGWTPIGWLGTKSLRTLLS